MNMNQGMDGNSMMWAMGFGGLLISIIAILGVAALVKYLFFSK